MTHPIMITTSTELFSELSRIESLGYDTVIQFCHSTADYDGGHVMHITKPSGRSVAWAKAPSKLEAIEACIKKFKKHERIS